MRMALWRGITGSGIKGKIKKSSSFPLSFLSYFSLSFKEKVVTKASLSCLKHLSLQLHHLTGISFKVSLKITVQMNPLGSEHFCNI